MEQARASSHRQGGQVLVLFALALTVLLLGVGLVIDGGYALAQRREAQNAADFAALAGARVVAEWINGDTADGSDANVQAAITASIAATGGTPVAFGASGGPQYVAGNGTLSGYVGAGTIPAGSVGVSVGSSRSWRPFFLGVIGITRWNASASATALGGYAAGGPSGAVFPAGIAEAFFVGRQPCAGPLSTNPASPCDPQQLTPGSLNVPGGFGWLKFGCAGYGLGQSAPANAGGCQTSATFLQTEIDATESYGCCTAVRLPGSADEIGSLPGNKASADCSALIQSGRVVTVAVWDTAGGQGSNAWYHIVGFTGFQITACDGGKDIAGVWRQPFWLGPTTTSPGFAGAPLAVQLVR